jgi:hypothetical protein
LRVQEANVRNMGMTEDSVMMYFYVVENKIVQKTEQVRNAMILQTFLGDSGQPSYFVRVMQQMPGTDEIRRKQTMAFIASLWDEIGPILTGVKEGLPEAPPEPMKTD